MHLYIFNVVYQNFFDGALTHTANKKNGIFSSNMAEFLMENKVVFLGENFFNEKYYHFPTLILCYYYITLCFLLHLHQVFSFLYCNARNLLYILIDFVSDTIVNMYLLIIYYVRSMFHFGKEKEEKSEKISKSQGFFTKKTNGDATRKSFQKLRRRTIYTTSAHSKDFMYGNIMCLKCQNRGYFD